MDAGQWPWRLKWTEFADLDLEIPDFGSRNPGRCLTLSFLLRRCILSLRMAVAIQRCFQRGPVGVEFLLAHCPIGSPRFVFKFVHSQLAGKQR